MADLGALRVAKQALDEGLIGPPDYDLVKIAFLKAQQIKAGLDAGFIRQGDYDKARDAYLHALDFSIMTAFPTPHAVQDHARAHAAPRTVSGPAAYVAHEAAAAGAGPSLYHNHTEPAAALQSAAAAAAAAPSQQYQAAPAPPRPPLIPTAEATPAPAAAAAVAAPPPQEPALPQLPAVRTVSQASIPGSAGPSAPASAAASASNTPRAGAGGGGNGDALDVPNYTKNMPHLDFTKVSMSGIGVKEECINMFLHAKTRSAFKWIIYKVDDSGKYVVPESWAGRGSTYAEFTSAMPERQCRYAVYDYNLNLDGRGSHNKLVFVNWAPSDCPVRQKMMFASTKDFFKRFLDGIGAELQATERSELSEAEMKEKVLTYVGAGGKV